MHEGRAVPLRAKSFELLGFLVENHERLVSNDELMKALWPDAFVTSGSLNQCLRDVRRALGDSGLTMIRTVAHLEWTRTFS